MAKDYYKILGVGKNASPDEIRASFRRLAHQYHPDKKGGNAEKFKEINEAHQVLSDKEKRAQYDQYGSTFDQAGSQGGTGFGGFGSGSPFGGGFGNGGQGFEFDLGDIFGDVFGGGGARTRTRTRTARGADIHMDAELTFKDAAFGVEKQVSLYKQVACDVCLGAGAEPGSSLKKCKTCDGQGQVVTNQRTILGTFQSASVCNDCHGEGKRPEKACKHCGGNGVIKKHSEFSLKIPGGIDDGETIRVGGGGEAGAHGATPGDLYLTVHVKSDSRFERDGFNVHSTVTIQFAQAVLGDEVAVETLDGEVKMVIPEGTQPGQVFKLRERGIKQLRGSGRGDHLVRVEVSVPKKISRRQKELLQEFGSLS
ncbi:MAG: Chaperone protein DnaJ [Candidatus Magasanikbacteria bacterium GW2011_GWA2_45_39]|uniref:Chaperone protein DnaJ n=1 Tax=Candidatus Magasanikbacteria bacterium GW2011_GWA2_45_39 TaxID=1619041 RepID=A0A0G1QH64_9BACT|nr:MAG: Chaperone protein DnaJ [Candidatus Magasanikbacteria bacterium GW2011_GWA2_45_39]